MQIGRKGHRGQPIKMPSLRFKIVSEPLGKGQSSIEGESWLCVTCGNLFNPFELQFPNLNGLSHALLVGYSGGRQDSRKAGIHGQGRELLL